MPSVRFWRLMFSLSLVAILSATPARQAEAASDFARSMAEVGEGNRVEEVDGGVGDDSVEALKADAPGMTAHPPVARWSNTLGLANRPGVLDRGGSGDAKLRASTTTPWHSSRSARRQAWLGRFRF